MKTSKLICISRILKRHIFRMKYENDTLFEALKLVREVYKYQFTKIPVSLHAHNEIIKKYNKKCLVLIRKSEISNIIKNIKEILRYK